MVSIAIPARGNIGVGVKLTAEIDGVGTLKCGILGGLLSSVHDVLAQHATAASAAKARGSRIITIRIYLAALGLRHGGPRLHIVQALDHIAVAVDRRMRMAVDGAARVLREKCGWGACARTCAVVGGRELEV